MTREQTMEILLLKLKSAITDKEMVKIRADHDLKRYGQWSCDYDGWMRDIQECEIDSILREVENEDKKTEQ